MKRGTLRKGTGAESSEYEIILLDNALVFGKTKLVKGKERIKVKRQPIPIDFVRVTSPKPKLLKRSNSLLSHLHRAASSSEDILTGINSTAPQPTRANHSVLFSHLGRGGSDLTLYTPSPNVRQLWIEAIRKLQKERHPSVFELVPTIQGPTSMGNVNHMITFGKSVKFVI